ncbi:shikimate kinase [Pararhodonellum marinum]|uniref:shikimate kinase n=1 Tax=Pararhodonellum marinum TaxID=2755358 RepID=UPI00293BFF7D|nr:shikimate kinase [Pararhodonellum marinum]
MLFKIVLVGLPGSGKSTLGKEISSSLKCPYFDLDQLITEHAKKSIPEIFENDGEGHFRDLESEVLSKLLPDSQNFVLATGGGTPCFNDNMELINENAISVFLDVPLQVILDRFSFDEISKRPLFQGLEKGELILKLKSLYAERFPYYNQAKIKLSGEDLTTELLNSELLSYFKS